MIRRDALEMQKARMSAQQLEELQQRLRGKARSQTISRHARDKQVPLSFCQQRLWFLDQLDPGNPYNVSAALHLVGIFDQSAMEHAYTDLLQRHETLRTTFDAVDGRPLQVIAAYPTSELITLDFEQVAQHERWDQVKQVARRETRRSFDLKQGPLVRLTLLRLGPRDHVLLLVMHHIISDEWSMSVFVRDLTTLYRGYAQEGSAPRMPELPIQYADFAYWQNETQQQELQRSQANYWRTQLAHLMPLELPLDAIRPAVQTFRGTTCRRAFPEQLPAALRMLSQREHVTLYTTLLAAFFLLLHRYCNQEDIVVGTPTAGRPYSELESLIGFFVNTLVVRNTLHENFDFLAVVRQVSETVLAAFAHQDVPFERVVETVQPERDLSRSPLFQIMFTLQNAPAEHLSFPGLTLSPLEIVNETSKFDLSVDIVESQQGLSIVVEYNTDLFVQQTVDLMIEHYFLLLQAIIDDPERAVVTLPLLTQPEIKRLIPIKSPSSALSGRCLLERIEEHARTQPDADAVILPTLDTTFSVKSALTYAQLNQHANQVTCALQRMGIGPEMSVGIYLERSPLLLVAILGVLKSGAAYVSLDPVYPVERVRFILEDVGVSVVITQNELQSMVADLPFPVIRIDEAGQEEMNDGCGRDSAVVTRELAAHIAYIIYTSGSTGVAKGVMITHESLRLAYTNWEHIYDLHPGMRHLQMANSSFDVFTGDWVRALCSGGTLVLCPSEALTSPELLYGLLRTYGIACGEFVPIVLRGLLTYLQTIGQDLTFMHMVIAGSDTWYGRDHNDLISLCGEQTRVINSYGVTEATIDSTYYENKTRAAITAEMPVPIGHPLPMTELYILDRWMQPAPAGAIGELYIAGPLLARGYHQRPALTAERFIPHPWAQGARLYRTGDSVRYRTDGTIELMGRIDQQVKVRGYRIEPAEVEAVLMLHEQVDAAAVVAHTNHEQVKALVAYIVAHETLQSNDVYLYLKQRLPGHMVPSSFVFVESLPKTPNGKLDRRSLSNREPTTASAATPYTEARNELERQIVDIWRRVLAIEQVGIDDSFFASGGHSLLVPQLVFQLRSTFAIDISLRQLFEAPTVAEMAQLVERILRGDSNEHARHIDWQAEALLDESIRTTSVLLPQRTVFLTGVTGFLGAYLLSDLLQRSSCTVYCLVRAQTEENARVRIQQNLLRYALWQERFGGRIIAVPGDLALPLFGLQQQQFDWLASKIDAIYHSGAWVNFTYPYQQLKPTNVSGTQEILRLASRGHGVSVHFVSTLSVFPEVDDKYERIIYEDDMASEPQRLLDGYAQSKWVGEQFVKEARERGIATQIYRVGRLGGHSRTGAANVKDLIWRVIKGCLQMKSAPDIDVPIDLAPVNYVSAAVVYLSRQAGYQNQNFHLFNGRSLPWRELVLWMQSKGYSVRLIPYDEWMTRLVQSASGNMNHALQAFMPGFSERNDGDTDNVPAYKVNFDDTKTLHALSAADIFCPAMDAALLETYFHYLKEEGFIDHP